MEKFATDNTRGDGHPVCIGNGCCYGMPGTRKEKHWIGETDDRGGHRCWKAQGNGEHP